MHLTISPFVISSLMEAVIIIQIHNSGMVLFWDVAAGKGVRQEWSGGAGGGR